MIKKMTNLVLQPFSILVTIQAPQATLMVKIQAPQATLMVKIQAP